MLFLFVTNCILKTVFSINERGRRNSRSFAPDLPLGVKDLLAVDLFRIYLLSRVDIVIRYIVGFVCASGLCRRYIEVLFHTFYCNFGRSLYSGLR